VKLRGLVFTAGLTALMMSCVIGSSFGAAGALQGPILHSDTVNAYATDVYTITFKRGELARVGVVGDGYTDLDLYIYDENGNLIDFDDDSTATCLCEWVPKWTGKFTIKIKNRGSVYSDYVLATN